MAKNNKRVKAVKLADKGLSAEKIAKKTGVKAKAAKKIVNRASSRAAASTPTSTSTPSPTDTASRKTSVQQISKKNTLSQNLRAASGANNVLSNKELLKISKKSGKDAEKVLEKAVGKGLMIGSGVVNKYQRGKYTDRRTSAYRSMANAVFPGAGFLDSPILSQLRNAGKQDKGSALFIGSKGSTATTLPRRLSAGLKQQADPMNTESMDYGQIDNSQPTDFQDPILPLPEEEPEPMSGPGMMSGGGTGPASASKLGRAKSRIRKLGIYGRGTGLLGRGLQYGNALNT